MRRVAVRAIIEKNGKLLLVKLKSHTGSVNDYYCTIGGGLDDNEGLINGLKREVLEETGVRAKVGALLCVQQYTDKHDNLEFFFHVTNTDDFIDIDLSKTSHGEEEIAELVFIDPNKHKVLPSFLQEIDFPDLIKSKEVKLFNYIK